MTKFHKIDTVGDDEDMGVDEFNRSMDMNFGDDVVDTSTGEVKE